MRRTRVRVVITALSAVMLAGCSGSETPDAALADDVEACQAEIGRMVDDLQRYVDGFAGMTAQQYATDLQAGPTDDVQRVVDRRNDQLTSLGCDPSTTRRQIFDEMDRLEGDGAIATTVAEGLRASLAGMSRTNPRRIEVSTDDDLAALAVTSPAGSTLVLAAGTHRVTEPILVGQPLVIEGASREDTRIRSTGDEVAILVLREGELDLRSVTVEHEATSTTAVIWVSATDYRFRDVRITGGVDGESVEEGRGAGVGLLLDPRGARSAPAGPRPRVQGSEGVWDRSLEGLEIVDNEGAGLVLVGSAAPRTADSIVRDNGSCGICFLGTAGGTFTGSQVSGNAVGIIATATADPIVSDNRIADNVGEGVIIDDQGAGTFEGNEIVDNGEGGVVVIDDASPRLGRNTLAGNGQIGIALGGASNAVLEGDDVRGHEIGIWVEGEAAAVFDGTMVSGEDAVGIVVGGNATATLTSVVIEGRQVGLEIREQASVTLEGLVRGSGEAAIVVRNDGALAGSGARCEDNPLDVVLLDAGTRSLDGDGCRVQDER